MLRLFNIGKTLSGLPQRIWASSKSPVWRYLDAEAPGAATRMAAATAATASPSRLRNDGLPAEGRQQAAQAVLELDLGLPAEQLRARA